MKKKLVIIGLLGFFLLFSIVGKIRFESLATEYTNSLNTEKQLALQELARQTTLPNSSTAQFSIITDKNIFPNFSQKALIENGDYMFSFPDNNKILIYRPTTRKHITTITLQ